MLLVLVGVVFIVLGATLLADEWRRSGTQNARINKNGLRFELVVLAAFLIAGGVASCYGGFAP